MFKIPKRILDTLGIVTNGSKGRRKNVIVDYKTENEGGHLTY